MTPSQPPQPPQSPRLLIVEDSRASQVGLAAMFRKLTGLKAPLLAETVSEALAHFADPGNPARPDVVILDLMLPGKPGESLIEGLREAGGPMPRIVVTTGCCDPDRMDRLRALKPDLVLIKPYERDDLLAAIAGAPVTPDPDR